jgi:osmotically inducible protein OsmC
MTKLEKVLYTAKAHTTSDRDGRLSRTDGERPAIFLSVTKLAVGKKKVRLPRDLAIDAEVDLGTTGEAYGLAARLNASLPGIGRQVALELADAADQPRGLR